MDVILATTHVELTASTSMVRVPSAWHEGTENGNVATMNFLGVFSGATMLGCCYRT